MATVQLSNVIDVKVFQDLDAVNSPEKTVFYESGIVVRNSLLDGLATQAGRVAELPFWNDIDPTSVPNLSTDNPANVASPDNVVQGSQICRKAFLNKGWSASDLASEVAMGARAMEHIRARVDNYWTRQFQRRVISTAKGLLADNVAANSGDMRINIAAEATGSVTAATKFNRDAFVESVYTMGDSADGLKVMAVHSATMALMVKNDDIVYIPDSKGELSIPTYLGVRVVVDDSMPVRAGTTSGFVYTSMIFGAGAFGYGDGVPLNPVEVERQAAQGNGAGIETLWTRKTWILHPFGYKDTGTPSATSYSLAELEAATTWQRVIPRKLVPLAFIDHNV
jgi:hypothetical protein